MADRDLTFNQDNLFTEQETKLLQENEQELEGERKLETEREEEQEHEDEQGQEQEQENKQKKKNVDASTGVADRWPGWPGESVFRMLVPSQKVGRIIGRKGEFIKKMCEESKARIKILDGPAGTPERVVMISAKEEPDLSFPPAVDGLLRVHKRVMDGLDGFSSHAHARASGVKVTTRLLVPAGQAENLTGKQGTTVKSIQEKSDCIVRITEDLPSFALQADRIVEMVGEPTAVHKALELVAQNLKKFLVHRSIIPFFETQGTAAAVAPTLDGGAYATQKVKSILKASHTADQAARVLRSRTSGMDIGQLGTAAAAAPTLDGGAYATQKVKLILKASHTADQAARVLRSKTSGMDIRQLLRAIVRCVREDTVSSSFPAEVVQVICKNPRMLEDILREVYMDTEVRSVSELRQLGIFFVRLLYVGAITPHALGVFQASRPFTGPFFRSLRLFFSPREIEDMVVRYLYVRGDEDQNRHIRKLFSVHGVTIREPQARNT